MWSFFSPEASWEFWEHILGLCSCKLSAEQHVEDRQRRKPYRKLMSARKNKANDEDYRDEP
jgi:hypothetical protein